MKFTRLLSGLILLLTQNLYSQAPVPAEQHQLSIRKSKEVIRLDGALDDAAWQSA